MANIPKLRLMLARLEKEASSRWRTLQGLTALLGDTTVKSYPRLGALHLAAAKQKLNPTGIEFNKAISSLPEGPLGNPGLLPPSQVFRGATEPKQLYTPSGYYSYDHLHASPFKEIAKKYSAVNVPRVQPPLDLMGVYSTTKNQKYAPGYGFEDLRLLDTVQRTNLADPTKGSSYFSGMLRNLFKSRSALADSNKNQIYETMVQPSQLQSVLLNNRVLPATAKGRELLQTGTMPAGAQLPPEILKSAGVFTASGNKVQGVGLRKLYHSLLDERGLTGLGVNNEDTGDVELSFDGDEARRKEVFKELAARIKAKTNHPVTFAPTTVPQTSTPVKLSNKDSERLNAIHHLAYRMSNMYDPTHPLMDPNDTFKQKLADRFRLQVNKRGLTGTVPSRAAEQLLGTRPMYAGMMPARRTRSEAEALSDMPMTQQQRLLKALKSGRGFLAPAGG